MKTVGAEESGRPIPVEQDRVVAWAQQLRHGRALRRVLERFDEAQIPALPVKGIISAHTLYSDVADRLLTDVDLKIRRRDFDRVLALGKREGWRVVQRMRAYANVVFVVEGVCVDIEGYPSVPGLSRLTVDAMIDRAAPSDVLGFPHLLPSFDDHAVLLLLNVFKDKLVHAFAWAVKDVERLPSHQDFDPLRLVEHLRKAGATTIGWVVADWMVRERQILGWRTVRDAIGPRPPRTPYVALLQWLREMQPRGTLALRILARAGADHRIDQAGALLRMVWWQTEAWASRWGEAPFRRQDPAHLRGTIASESQRPGLPKDGI
ncbi:MAG TPA: nucleotidyltransferase family protein [Polyangiaceae bacterium]|nr:nucleotidyltransferase family protein [Polyangiaceae bacterium]